MGSSQRLAAVAAVSHAKHYYNHTQIHSQQAESSQFTLNVFFVSATLCGVLVAVCAACWKRSPSSDKPEDVVECHGIYTVSGDTRLSQVSGDTRLSQVQIDVPGPPPAYETLAEGQSHHKDCAHILQETVTEPCPRCQSSHGDAELPSYEAALMLRDTKI
uniref:Uncharacterized protein n=1 Tax=Bombyx mori TaxID=7091 RepID=A0A8R2M403_BOMMO|nr:uncharacterized protein LOC105842239 isoform X1 [Bombyx mori]